jgi:peptidoglycan hydrolase CwlO-like protein
MKKVVADKELVDYRNKCGDEIKKCEKAVNYGIAENAKRTDEMWKNCKNLTKNTSELKNIITNLHNRINRIENALGYYNGADIVSNY